MYNSPCFVLVYVVLGQVKDVLKKLNLAGALIIDPFYTVYFIPVEYSPGVARELFSNGVPFSLVVSRTPLDFNASYPYTPVQG